MTITVKHAHQTAIGNDASKDVSANAWNDNHTVTGVRDSLSADTTVNVPADYATLDLALAYAATIDFAGHKLTIQLANGTYSPASSAGFQVPATVGQANIGDLIIQGDTTTPSNVVLSSTAHFSGIVVANTGARCLVKGVQLKGDSNQTFGLYANGGGYIQYTAIDANTGLYCACYSQANGVTECLGTLTISASMFAGIYATNKGDAYQIGSTITLTGTPAWTAGYAWAEKVSFIRVAGGTTFTGSATGIRYSLQSNAVIVTSTGSATFFPGDTGPFADGSGIYTT